MKLTLGFSPCPNDTFIFDALVNQKIDTEGLEFETVLKDVEALNEAALSGSPDISKISYAILPLLLKDYLLLNSGSALGRGVGPLLIAKHELNRQAVAAAVVAIPGEHTTAHFLFSMAYPDAKNKIFLRYDEIEAYVLDGKGPGVIIHENRFTYREKGLSKIADLGEFWETQTGNPIPLGGIVIKRSIDRAIQQTVERLIRKSLEFAYAAYPQLNNYIKDHAQEMSEDVMRKHIELYVNNYSLTLGMEGKKAVMKMLEIYGKSGLLMINEQDIFVSNN